MKEEKKELRKSIIAQLSDLTHEEITRKSVRIAEHLFATRFWRKASFVLCFVSMPEEVETELIITTALEQGKRVALPRLRNSEMDFHVIPKYDIEWEVHSYGMKEPPADYPIFTPPEHAQEDVLMVLPGLGFDHEGGRLGRGGGFYDKYLHHYRENILTFGVCFHFQLVDSVPTAEHDCLISGVVTEEGVFPSACCPPEVFDERAFLE